MSKVKEVTLTKAEMASHCEKRTRELNQKIDSLRGDIEALTAAHQRGNDAMSPRDRILMGGAIIELRQQLDAAQQLHEAWRIASTVW